MTLNDIIIAVIISSIRPGNWEKFQKIFKNLDLTRSVIKGLLEIFLDSVGDQNDYNPIILY